MSPRRPTPWADTSGTVETRKRLGLILGGALVFAASFAGALHWRGIADWFAG